ncbi:unnamed protein product, partial [Phaeothamnion confervicola]
RESNVAVAFCKNGKTRTCVLMACYMRFMGGEDKNTHHAYVRLYRKRSEGPEVSEFGLDTLGNLPPSLLRYFSNFDEYMRLGRAPEEPVLQLLNVVVLGLNTRERPLL